GARSDLHSFPTRRSSDLGFSAGAVGESGPAIGSWTTPSTCSSPPATVATVASVSAGPVSGRAAPKPRPALNSLPNKRLPMELNRSEEHTSELQSLAYLVC